MSPRTRNWLLVAATVFPAAALAQSGSTPPAAIPEPAAFALFVLGVGVIGTAVRSRRG
jgi:hypothetical protein